MVSYNEAVAITQDPNADPIMLAKVAYENPEFGANVAANPRAYPGLLRWLAQFGDERARRMVGQMGIVSPLEPVQEQDDVQASDDHSGNEQAQHTQAQASQSAQGHAETITQYSEQADEHGFSAQLAATTNDPAIMQQIAQYAPLLRPALASNPYLYPELLAWLGMLGDAAVNEALAQRHG